VELVLYLVAQSCAGLHYAHNRTDASGRPLNIVHRDVSPQNLVVTFDGMLKVVDFGIAKAAVRETQTQSGTIKGKFAYMSPEQCLAENMDHRTDIFALGIITHEFLTGKRLFKRDNAYDTYHAILECKVPPPSELNHEIDPELDEITLKALTREADERYQTADEFADALMGILHRRGKSVNAASVSQFFDTQFATEISEHGQRMRALITGRQTSANTLDEYWEDLDDEIGAADQSALSPAGGDGPIATVDVDMGATIPEESSEVSVLDSSLLQEADDEDDEDDDGDDGGGATRIELNPLERIRHVHTTPRASGAGGGNQLAPPQQATGEGGAPGNEVDDDDNVKTLIADRTSQAEQLLATAAAMGQGQHSPGQPLIPNSQQSGPNPQQPPGPDSGPAPYGNPPQGGSWDGPQPYTPGGGINGLAPHQGHQGGPQGQGYHPMQSPPYGSPGFMPGTQEQHASRPPAWQLAVVFATCVGLGLGLTLLIARLF
jgi:serine/threonine-protein kinase